MSAVPSIPNIIAMTASSHPLIRPFIAEFLGTMALAAVAASASVGVSLFPQFTYLFVPFLVGLAVMVLVAVLGPVSGAHFNPAVSLGLWVAGRLAPVRLVLDVAAQLIGASLGVDLAKQLIGSSPAIGAGIGSTVFLGEACGAFLLVGTVAAAAMGKIEKSVAPLYIGAALTCGVTLALASSGGILNPAIALALGAHHLGYILGPLVGGLVAAPFVLWLLTADRHEGNGSQKT